MSMRASTRYNFWLKNSYCYWCGIKTRWMAEIKEQKHPLPFNSFTVDHLLNTWEAKRIALQNLKKEIPKVTACLNCNNARGRYDFHRLTFFKMLQSMDFGLTVRQFIGKKIWFYRKLWFTDYFDQFKDKEKYKNKLNICKENK